MSFRLVETGWDNEFATAAAALDQELRIVTPFLQLDAARKIVTKKLRTLSVVTRFNLDDLCAGVSSLDALDWLLAQGAEIRGIQNLHAKAYLFDDARAIVTSANLTTAALVRNHELGFITTGAALVAECRSYFDRLWSKGRLLDPALLAEIRTCIETARRVGGVIPARNKLGDLGAKIGLPPTPVPAPGSFPLGGTAYVKFFGSSTKGDRADRSKSTIKDVADCGSHWACTYPGHRAPRKLEDGDTMFIAQLVEAPTDILIYGRAIACQHNPAKDVATPEDIVRHPWKKDWPNYIRVHDAEFLAGILANGISLRRLAGELGESCFASTEERAAKGEAGINPLTTLGQKPDVRLSERGKQWVHEKLEAAFARHGRIPEAEMSALEWPAPPPAVTATPPGIPPGTPARNDGLSDRGRKLLRVLVEQVRSQQVSLGNPKTYPTYEGTLELLGVEPWDGRLGPQLIQHGLADLAEWIRDRADLNLPAITGLIVLKAQLVPGGEFFAVYRRSKTDYAWWDREVRRVGSVDWNPYL